MGKTREERAINGTWSAVMLQFACGDISANRSAAPEKWEEHRSIHKVSSSSNKGRGVCCILSALFHDGAMHCRQTHMQKESPLYTFHEKQNSIECSVMT